MHQVHAYHSRTYWHFTLDLLMRDFPRVSQILPPVGDARLFGKIVGVPDLIAKLKAYEPIQEQRIAKS